MPLDEYAAEREEGARAAAVVVSVGALTGQPGQQPRFKFRITGKADVIAIHGTVGTSGSHSRRCLASSVTMLITLTERLTFLGMAVSSMDE
jgi:hypothetical protein